MEPVGRRAHDAERAPARAQVLLQADHGVVGRRLDLIAIRRAEAVAHVGVRRLCHRVQHAERPTTACLPRQLDRADDLGRPGRAGVAAALVRGDVRRPADAARVEQHLGRALVDRHLKQARAFDEEGTLLLERGLEPREVHLGGVGLDLPEVRMQREIERQAGGHPELRVRADCGRGQRWLEERIRAVAGRADQARARIGEHLTAAGRRQVVETGEVAAARDQASLPLGHGGPARPFLPPRHVAEEIHAPGRGLGVRLAGLPRPPSRPAGVVVQLGQRDPELRRPAERVAGHRDVPHRVPAHIGFDVVVVVDVELHARGVDHEVEGGAAVVVAVEHHVQIVRTGPHVAARERRHDAVGVLVRAQRHVYGGVREQHARFGAVGRGAPVERVVLREVGGNGSGGPGGVVEPAVDRGRGDAGGPYGAQHPRTGGMRRGSGRSARSDRRDAEPEGDQNGPHHGGAPRSTNCLVERTSPLPPCQLSF